MRHCNLCKSAITTLCSVQFLNFYFMKIDHMKGNYFKCPLLWAERSTSVCLVSFLWQFPSHCHVWWGVSMSKLLVGLWLPSGSVCLSFSGLLSLILVHSDSVWLTPGSLSCSFGSQGPCSARHVVAVLPQFIPPWEVLFIDIQETLAPRCFLCKRKCHPHLKTYLAQVKLTKIFLKALLGVA